MNFKNAIAVLLVALLAFKIIVTREDDDTKAGRSIPSIDTIAAGEKQPSEYMSSIPVTSSLRPAEKIAQDIAVEPGEEEPDRLDERPEGHILGSASEIHPGKRVHKTFDTYAAKAVETYQNRPDYRPHYGERYSRHTAHTG